MFGKHLIVPLSVFLLGACSHNGSSIDAEREGIFAALPGTYLGEIASSEGGAASVTHSFQKIDAPQFGSHVLYYEIDSDDPNGPGVQRKIFVFDDAPNRQENRMKAYLITDAQMPSGEWSSINPAELRTFPDECAFLWSQVEGGYAGIVKSSDCAFPSQVFGGTIRSDMTYQITGDALAWEEVLLTDTLDVIVSTNGLQTALRRSSTNK